MDWSECLKNNIVKDISVDEKKIHSIKEVSREKIRSSHYLPPDHKISKVTLLYDGLRELLEAKALEQGFKIYNHECYAAFFQEILGKSSEAKRFDEMRHIRNGIN
ncbi:MAG: hypothetical protein ACMXYK_02965, partial [Candidatus Woesearchaeota archaeon]